MVERYWQTIVTAKAIQNQADNIQNPENTSSQAQYSCYFSLLSTKSKQLP